MIKQPFSAGFSQEVLDLQFTRMASENCRFHNSSIGLERFSTLDDIAGKFYSGLLLFAVVCAYNQSISLFYSSHCNCKTYRDF